MSKRRKTRVPATPDLPAVEKLTKAHTFSPTDDEQMELLLLTGGSAGKLFTSHVTLRESIVQDFDLSETEFRYFDAADLLIERCDVANSVWTSFIGVRLLWKNCRLLGIAANESELLSTKFEDCLMQLAQFRFSMLAGAWFERCNLRDADFSGANLTGATFSHCDLTGVAFSEAECVGMDLRTSTIDGLTVGSEELVGVVINPLQAVEIAKAFGVRVLDEFVEIT